jgi:uncharacterized protein
VVKVSQRVTVTVTEVDLARKRIALSMRSRPEIGGRAPAGAAGASGNRGPGHGGSSSGGPRGNNGGGSFNRGASSSSSGNSLGGDWFTAALNKKK